MLPKAHYDWMHLRLQDFKSVRQYKLALFKYFSKLKLCGVKITDANLLENTFSNFHALNCFYNSNIESKDLESILN